VSFFKPKKSLGQNILLDTNIARKIVNSLTLKNYSGILEIGPGTGILTEFILELGIENIYLVEVDSSAIEILERKYAEHKKRIIHEDFLKLNLELLFPGKFAIIGNFPYNLSSQIFFKILDNKDKVTEVVCMVQKEVARRISSSPGNKDYGILSVLLQTYYNIDYLFTVNESVFYPQPKVKSSVIRLLRNNRKELECDRELFFRVVKAGFNQRRKILRNSLKSILLNLEINDSLFQMRPEQLTVEEFIDLTIKIEEAVKSINHSKLKKNAI
jgi:16S rRNA (adenine1518-N6/adenine1519-N6)-dimethyltransferase